MKYLLGPIACILYFVGLFYLFASESAVLTCTLTAILFLLPGIGALVFAIRGRGAGDSSVSRVGNVIGTITFILLGLMLLGLGIIVLLRKL